MAICLICNGRNRTAVDAALMAGISTRTVAAQFGVTKSGVSRHATGCLRPKVAAAIRNAAPGPSVLRTPKQSSAAPAAPVTAEPDLIEEDADRTDDLTLQSLLARTARSMDRLERAARAAANDGLHTALAAASGQLHKAIEMAAKIQGLYAEPAAPGAGTALQINITLPSGALPTPGSYSAPLAACDAPPTLLIDMTPKIIEPELPPKPAGYVVPDFVLTNDLVGPALP